MAEISRPEINVVLNDKTKQGTDSVNSNLDKINKKASSLTKAFDKAFGSVKTALFGVGIAGVTSKIIQATRRSSDFIEQLNVLDVAFNDNTKSIREFTSNIAETLNLDDASLIKMASSFKILANSMGYADEMGTKFSKLMTSITTDTASLFNMTLSDTQAMMQSAVQGQTKALRKRTGVSILDRDVQTTLDVLGIDAYVQNMNSAEKSLARVITMTYRLRESQGDLARTIESPANRFRVLSEQISLLARNIGNVFLPTISAILPYLNAVLIVLNKLISSLATLLGFREDAWDTYKAQTDTLSEAFDDLGTSVGGVGNAAKETKKQLNGLRGFDKLNVIKTPTPSSASGGGGGSGIDPNLLKAFNTMFDNYNSMLDGVETKATKIAKAIMNALGEIDFTNLINAGKRLWDAFKPFAENVGQGLLWTFNNVLTPLAKWTISDLLPTFLNILADAFIILNNTLETFKPIGEWLWKNFLSPLGKWAGGTIVKALQTIDSLLRKIGNNKLLSSLIVGGLLASRLGKIVTILGKTKLLGALSNLISPLTTLITKTKTWQTLSPKIGDGLLVVSQTLGKLKGALIDVGLASVGLIGFKTSMDDIAASGINLGNSLGAVSSGLATIGGFVSAGNAMLPGYGALLGGLVGTLGLLYTSLDALNGKTKTSAELINEQRDAIQKLNDKAIENIDLVFTQTDRAAELSTELGKYVDENGKVVGSTDKVNSILNELNGLLGTEYEVTGNTITQNGKKIKSLKGIQDEIDKYIKKLKSQVIQEQVQSLYKDALDKQIKAMQQRNEKADIINELTKKAIENNGILSLEEKQRLDQAKTDYENLSASIDGYQKNMDNYSKAGLEAQKGNYDKAVEYLSKSEKGVYKSFDDLMKDGDKNLSQSITDMKTKLKELGDTKIKIKGTLEVDDTGLTKLKNQLKKEKVTFKSSSGTTIVGSFDLTRKANGGIFVNNKWRDIATYDTGGLPPVGQMFVARERGPELVGNIGGHTAVMNNNQIVSSVSSGVAQAVRSVMNNNKNGGGVYNIYLDKDHKIGSYTLEQLQGMAKSNGKPITIG